jgi:predicted alpha/beta superfamily hydrolase
MHDGQNLFHDDEAFAGVSWDVEGAMDGGAADALIGEAIVVGIDNDADRIWEYTPTDGGYGGGGADAYVGFVADELKPAIDRDFHTLPDRDHTAIVGSSLGGLVSIYAGITRADTFGVVGALSPSTWWDGTWIIARVSAAATLPGRIYVDSGDDDRDDTARLADALRTRGANLDYVVAPGQQHSEVYWRRRLPGALAFLVGPR